MLLKEEEGEEEKEEEAEEEEEKEKEKEKENSRGQQVIHNGRGVLMNINQNTC